MTFAGVSPSGVGVGTHDLFDFSNNVIGDLKVTDLDAPAPAPEPAAWALMLAGFGLAGAALRQGRAAAAG